MSLPQPLHDEMELKLDLGRRRILCDYLAADINSGREYRRRTAHESGARPDTADRFQKFSGVRPSRGYRDRCSVSYLAGVIGAHHGEDPLFDAQRTPLLRSGDAVTAVTGKV